MSDTLSSHLETLVANIIGQVQPVTIGGEQYLKCPMTILKEGVLHGSQGPLYYDRTDIERSTGDWEKIPLVAYHPTSPDGSHLSANDEGVLERQGIGFFSGPHYRKAKIKGHGYFNINRLKKVNRSILDNLKAGKPIELSTGLFTTNLPAAEGSNYNGKSYSHRATEYRPDHLAVLPDQVGACSIRDGCGVLVNKDNNPSTDNIVFAHNISATTLKAADFVQLAPKVVKDGGTNCTNCRFSANGKCEYNNEVDLRGLPVDNTTCCSFWDSKGTERPWKAYAEVTGNRVEVNGSSGATITMNRTSVAEFFATLLHGSTSAHILHLSSRSFAAHSALDILYKKLPKKVDTLIECWQGINQLITDWPSGYIPPTEPATFVKSLCDYIAANRMVLGSESQIQNLVDEVASLLDNTIYRLRFLS